MTLMDQQTLASATDATSAEGQDDTTAATHAMESGISCLLQPIQQQHQAVRQQILTTLAMVRLVSEFSSRLAQFYADSATQLQDIGAEFAEKSELLLSAEAPATSSNNSSSSSSRRLPPCTSVVQPLWKFLVAECQTEAKAYTRLANSLSTRVAGQLTHLAASKSIQAAGLFASFGRLESAVAAADADCSVQLADLQQCLQSAASSTGASSLSNSTAEAYNRYAMQLAACNAVRLAVRDSALPEVMQELDHIETDAVCSIHEALASHRQFKLDLLESLTERNMSGLNDIQNSRPQDGILEFAAACLSATPRLDEFEDEKNSNNWLKQFPIEPLQTNVPLPQSGEVLRTRASKSQLKQKSNLLRAEHQRLRSSVRDTRDAMDALMVGYDRHLRTQRFDRVYKCESDLSRCQNEIRLTALKLAQVQAQMDLLNMKRDDSDDEESDDRKDEASIKGLWKRAFSSLKIRDRIKSPKKKKGSKNDEDDVDPVYYLLKHAADKGTQRCPACSQQPTTSSGGASASASVCSSSCSCHCHSRQAQHQAGTARFYQQPPSAPTPPPTPLPGIRLNDPSQSSHRRPQSQSGHATLTHQTSAPSAVKRSEQQQMVKNRKK